MLNTNTYLPLVAPCHRRPPTKTSIKVTSRLPWIGHLTELRESWKAEAEQAFETVTRLEDEQAALRATLASRGSVASAPARAHGLGRPDHDETGNQHYKVYKKSRLHLKRGLFL